MSLEQICLEQEEIIEKQAAQIRGLLSELMQLRALTEEEEACLGIHKDKEKQKQEG